ncbi:zinc-binding dehydrogenase [Conexibacter sp. W3-3-2]|uniref:zinc-binding dehydrogenase n=1 Tax=Conexibacter sp. W3-3-2 TaxID=2675227 RepID=UPI00132910E1|nr:zinc-binding dehydrogenase [Conexibacter sp. W3-3-2]MTD45836.1 zinc-binding dehydrogenase [Conexibacter sp. W3-3-2]
MRAVVLQEFGEPAVLRVHDGVPDPVVPDGWVLVRLHACALNWHDVLLRQGVYDVPLPRVPGSDGAGVRADTGEQVLVLPSLFWGGAERAPGPGFQILGDRTDGTHAELVALPAENVRPLPAGWSFVEAAALPLAGLTAYRALFARAGLVAGETVLVLGAGGGVATMAIALARMAGARVLVTTSTEEKLERAIGLGADGGVLYTSAHWGAAVREMAGGVGVDVVVDSVGSTWPDALTALADGGRLVTFGATGSADAHVDVRRLYFAQQTILGTTMGSPRDADGLLALVAQAPDWRPAIDAVAPLDEIAAMHERMARREHVGKLVLTVP